MSLDPQSFLHALREEIEAHPAVQHPFLRSLSRLPFVKEDYLIFAEHHYPLVCLYRRHLEGLRTKALEREVKLWIGRVLVDFSGEPGGDHPALYARFLKATGGDPQGLMTRPVPVPTQNYLETCNRIVLDMEEGEAIGAFGPAHQWALPPIFLGLLPRLQDAGFSREDIYFFRIHSREDSFQKKLLREALLRCLRSEEDMEGIRRGTMICLEARKEFWDGVEAAVIRNLERRFEENSALKKREKAERGLLIPRPKREKRKAGEPGTLARLLELTKDLRG